MKVVSYFQTVPVPNNNKQKEELLEKFALGATQCGDEGLYHKGNNLLDCDVAVIQGWVYSQLGSAHLRLRHNIIETQKQKKKHTVTADANLFLYNDKTNPHGYLRYSFDGIFPSTGLYCDSKIDPNRWNQISKDTGIVLDNYKTTGKNIILLLQRQGGWSMKGKDVIQWTLDVCKEIRKYSSRPIVLRSHPNDKQAKISTQILQKKLQGIPNIIFSVQKTPLDNDLKNAWAVVNHNSSAAVGPIIKGYHCFLTDATDSQCKEVANTDFSRIESPQEFDRELWLQRISMFHWKFDELANGKCWRHMREFI